MKRNISKLIILFIFVALTIGYTIYLINNENFAAPFFDISNFALKLSPIVLLWALYVLMVSYFNVFKQVNNLSRFFSIISEDPDNIEGKRFASVLNTLIAKEEELLTKKQKEFISSFELLTTKTQNIGVSLDKTMQDLATKSNYITQNIAELVVNLDKKLSNLNETASIIKNSSFEDETAQIVNLAKTTVDQINEASFRLETIIENSKTQSVMIINKIEDLVTTNANANVLFETNCNKLINTSHKVLEETSALDKLVAEENELLIEKSQKARESAVEFKEILEEQIQNLAQASSHAGTYITIAENSLEKQTSKLTSYINDFYKQVENVKGQIGSATGELLKFSNEVNSEINHIGNSVSKTVEDTYTKSKEILVHVQNDSVNISSSISNSIEKAQVLLNEMLKVKENLKPFIEYMAQNISKIPAITKQSQDSVITLRDDIQIAINNLANLFENLNNTIESTKDVVMNLQDMSEASINELYDGSQKLKQESQTFTQTTLTAHKSLQALANESKASILDLGQKTSELLKTGSEIENLITDKIGNLEKATVAAQNKIKEFKETESNITTNLFSQKAGVILENLQTVSVDIARLLTPSIKEEIWTKYYDGQKDIFVKYLAKILTPEKVDKIKAMVLKNETLKDYIVTFVKSFDEVLKSAKQSEHKDVLTVTYMQTDLAQIYLILKQVF